MGKLKHVFSGLKAKKKNHSDHRESDLWVFGEWFGDRCCDNSRYFAEYVSEAHPEIRVKWITKADTDKASLNPAIEVIKMDSEKAKEVFSKCGAAVISQGFKDLSSEGFNFVDGAVTVHLWHGIPWKKIGHDGSKNNGPLAGLYRGLSDKAFGTDFYASPSDEYDKIAVSAHGAKKEQMIHTGYARNADFYSAEKVAAGKSRIIAELKKISPDVDYSNVRIISYMPTFRKDPSGFFPFDSLRNNERFIKYLEDNNIIVIQKAHYVNQTRDGKTDTKGSNRIYMLNNIAAQDLLCATDLLVSDYSGAFFDFLILDRPVVHFLYDYDYYRTADRGLYYDKEDVIAGEEAGNEEQLVDAVIRNMDDPDLYKERRHLIRNTYLKYDTPDSCEILFQAIVKEIRQRGFKPGI